MHLRSYSKIALRQWRGGRALKLSGYSLSARSFHASARALVIKPFLLADIGEGLLQFSYSAVYLLCALVKGCCEAMSTAVLEHIIANSQQESENARSFNGSSSPKLESKNSTNSAKSKAIKPLSKLQVDSRE